MTVLSDDGCARLPILPAETAAMPEAGGWAARISSAALAKSVILVAALAKSVILVAGSQASTTRKDSGSCRRKRVRKRAR